MWMNVYYLNSPWSAVKLSSVDRSAVRKRLRTPELDDYINVISLKSKTFKNTNTHFCLTKTLTLIIVLLYISKKTGLRQEKNTDTSCDISDFFSGCTFFSVIFACWVLHSEPLSFNKQIKYELIWLFYKISVGRWSDVKKAPSNLMWLWNQWGDLWSYTYK